MITAASANDREPIQPMNEHPPDETAPGGNPREVEPAGPADPYLPPAEPRRSRRVLPMWAWVLPLVVVAIALMWYVLTRGEPTSPLDLVPTELGTGNEVESDSNNGDEIRIIPVPEPVIEPRDAPRTTPGPESGSEPGPGSPPEPAAEAENPAESPDGPI